MQQDTDDKNRFLFGFLLDSDGQNHTKKLLFLWLKDCL